MRVLKVIFICMAFYLMNPGSSTAQTEWISGPYPIPNAPSFGAPYKLHASGWFGCHGWQYWSTDPYPYYTFSNNCYTIRLESFLDLNYLHLQVLTPWEAEVQIGPMFVFEPTVFHAKVIMTDLTFGGAITSTTSYVVGPRPIIRTLSTTNCDLVFSWPSYTNLHYSVQCSTQLTATSWKCLPAFSNRPGDPSFISHQTTMTNTPRMFYRVVSAP